MENGVDKRNWPSDQPVFVIPLCFTKRGPGSPINAKRTSRSPLHVALDGIAELKSGWFTVPGTEAKTNSQLPGLIASFMRWRKRQVINNDIGYDRDAATNKLRFFWMGDSDTPEPAPATPRRTPAPVAPGVKGKPIPVSSPATWVPQRAQRIRNDSGAKGGGT